MPRPKKTEQEIRANLASARTMLSDARRERDRAADALIAVLDVTEGCTCGKKEQARRIALKALDGIIDGDAASRAEGRIDAGISGQAVCPACQEITCDTDCEKAVARS